MRTTRSTILKKRTLFALALAAICVMPSCNRPDNYIIPVDYEKYYKGVTGLTEKESQEIYFKVMEEWYKNTLGKEIPDIEVKDLDGNTIMLKKWLKKETILVFTGPHCGFGMEEADKEFPSALHNMKDELQGIDILCLVELAKESDQQVTLDYAKTLQGAYDNLFIINHMEALKTNLTACPTKFFIDEKQIVRHVHIGLALDQEKREEEIRIGVALMRKQSNENNL